MCGIVGYWGAEECSKLLLDSIKTLEYRGYDSIGMATKGKTIECRKGIGKIAEVDKKLDFSSMLGNVGIAHTRWATTGKVSIENSHPHKSSDNKVLAVHNGIIENYQELRRYLESQDIKFNSQTDTEVIPQLISFFMKKGKNVIESFSETLKMLEGSYALAIIVDGYDGLLFAKKESPLVIGILDDKKKSGYFIASDVLAFISHTNKVVYLKDFEYGTIDKDGIKVFSLNNSNGNNTNNQIEICPIYVKIDKEQAKKGDYEHYMLKEITEQKVTIKKAIEQDMDQLINFVNELKKAKGIFFVGCGTSYHAAVSASYLFSHISKVHVNTVLASEFRNYNEFLNNKTVFVAISQSGETADLIDAISVAKSKGVKILSIVNVYGSTISRMSDLCINMNAGPEICVLSTKSYTSQVAILTLLSYMMADKYEEGKENILSASAEVSRIIESEENHIKKIAEKLYPKKNLFLIGRDLAYPSALEGALKIKEVSYIHAEGFAGGELKHGTIALIENDTPCIVLDTQQTHHAILSNASEVKARGAYTIAIGEKNNEIYDDFIQVKDLGSSNPIGMIIPIQLLAYYTAKLKGCDPDKPRNLAKSVTVK